MFKKEYKLEKLVMLFKKQDKLDIEYVLQKTGIVNRRSLAGNISYLRKLGIIDLRIKWGFVIKK